jgi:hypothetical protein
VWHLALVNQISWSMQLSHPRTCPGKKKSSATKWKAPTRSSLSCSTVEIESKKPIRIAYPTCLLIILPAKLVVLVGSANETWLAGLILITNLSGAEFDAGPTEQLVSAL